MAYYALVTALATALRNHYRILYICYCIFVPRLLNVETAFCRQQSGLCDKTTLASSHHKEPVTFDALGNVVLPKNFAAKPVHKLTVTFHELGNIILPPDALELLSHVMVVQGQESRASTDALLNSSVNTPEELISFSCYSVGLILPVWAPPLSSHY